VLELGNARDCAAGRNQEDNVTEMLITATGFSRLQADLNALYREREALVERIRTALEQSADLGGNGEYLDARHEQALLDRRIAQLEERLEEAEIVTEGPTDGEVDVGERVRVRDINTGETFDFHIVGVAESEPAAGAISYQSPIGAALLGRRSGDIVAVDAPKGPLRFEVLEVDG
jgi:transcription elongation factor GreA